MSDLLIERYSQLLAALRAQLATVERELEAWRNCFICLDCGRCKADEDGCCASCGRDCLFFADGKKIFDVDAQEAVVARDTAEKIDYYAGLP